MPINHSRGRRRRNGADPKQQLLPLSSAPADPRSAPAPASNDARVQCAQDSSPTGDTRKVSVEVKGRGTLPSITLSVRDSRGRFAHPVAWCALGVAFATTASIAGHWNERVVTQVVEQAPAGSARSSSRERGNGVATERMRPQTPLATTTISERSLELGATGSLRTSQCPAAAPAP